MCRKITYEIGDGKKIDFTERIEDTILVRIRCNCGELFSRNNEKCFSRVVMIFPTHEEPCFGKFTFPRSGSSTEVTGTCQLCGKDLTSWIEYNPDTIIE